MLETYGLHEIVWNAADQAIGGELVASSNDVRGRGIALTVREGGAAANLTGATAYLVWCHRATGERGTVAFDAVNAAEGAFRVYYPGAMCSAAGAVDAQIMLSLGSGRYISTRTFVIHFSIRERSSASKDRISRPSFSRCSGFILLPSPLRSSAHRPQQALRSYTP